MVTVNRQVVAPEVEKICEKLAQTTEFGPFFKDGDVDFKEAKYLLSSDAGETVGQPTLDGINEQLQAVGQSPITIDDLALLYEAFNEKLNSSTQPFYMPNNFSTQQLDRARAMIGGPPLKVENNLTPAAQRYASDPEFKAVKVDLRQMSLLTTDPFKQLCKTKIVRDNPDAFIRDAIVADSNLYFNPSDPAVAAAMIGELSKLGASLDATQELIQMYSKMFSQDPLGGMLFNAELSRVMSVIEIATPPTKPLAQVVSWENVPQDVSDIYNFALSADKKKLTVDPKYTSTGPATRGVTVTNSAQGGKVIELDGGPFKNGKWVWASFAQLTNDEVTLQKLKNAKYDIHKPRDILVVNGENDVEPTLLAFSLDRNIPGLVSVCSEVGVHDFSSGGGVTVRKPVIYLYPETKQNIRVGVDIKGEFLVRYPAPDENTWDIIAQPDGTLFDRKTERKYSYLFWEAENPLGFKIDPAQAFLVRDTEVVHFLEQICNKFALNDKESTDFITYWLPALQKNPFNLVQFIDKEYEEYARLLVDPKPETVIRMFMVFKRVPEPVEVGSPVLPSLNRKGFTVVEWGGANLDEH